MRGVGGLLAQRRGVEGDSRFWEVDGCWGRFRFLCNVGCWRELKVPRLVIAVAFALLLVFSNVPRLVSAQATQGFNPVCNFPSAEKDYVNTLMSGYNSLVREYQYGQPNFTENEQYFALWGDSFYVRVMEYNASTPLYIGFVFEKNFTNGVYVHTDCNNTVQDLFTARPTSGGNTYVFGPGYSYSDRGVSSVQFNAYSNTTGLPDFISAIWYAPLYSVLSNNEANASNAAYFIYQSNLKMIQSIHAYFANQTSTHSTTGPFSFLEPFNDNPVIKAIDAIFGSVLVLILIVVVLIVALTRRRVRQEIRDALHMEQPRPAKKEQKKPKKH